MATQLVVPPPTSMVSRTSDQTLALALNDALIASRTGQQELLQAFEKFKIVSDRVMLEIVEIRKENVILKGMIEMQNQVFNEKLQALSGQIDAVQRLTLEQAKQLINNSEEKTNRKVEQVCSDVKTAYNTHGHNYWRALSTPSEPHPTSQPNKLL